MPRPLLITGTDADEAATAYRQGASIRRLADRYQVGYGAMHAMLSRRDDVTLRRRGGASVVSTGGRGRA